jgi:probable rRNA maturation factor
MPRLPPSRIIFLDPGAGKPLSSRPAHDDPPRSRPGLPPRLETHFGEILCWARRFRTSYRSPHPFGPHAQPFLDAAQIAVRLRGQVSILLTTDAAIRKLNRQFRGKNKPTDVLSFPAAQLRGTKIAERVAGDLAISIDTARKQATACRHSLRTELKVLILHGLLHLAGYDHETDHGKMARREELLRARLKLPLGLIVRAASDSASERVGKPAPRPKP